MVEDVGFRVLAAGNAPYFRTSADFRKIHRKALEGFFEQVLRMALEVGAVIYAARQAMVEAVFGPIQQARGFRRFSLRGLAKVPAEWALGCATHNRLKLYRLG